MSKYFFLTSSILLLLSVVLFNNLNIVKCQEYEYVNWRNGSVNSTNSDSTAVNITTTMPTNKTESNVTTTPINIVTTTLSSSGKHFTNLLYFVTLYI